jgi:chromosome partitioning protein
MATTSLFDDELIELPQVRKSIALIHGTPQLANLERATAGEANRRVQTLAAQLEAIGGEFDYCLLEAPPTLGIRMIAALADADFVALPVPFRHRWDVLAACVLFVIGYLLFRAPMHGVQRLLP